MFRRTRHSFLYLCLAVASLLSLAVSLILIFSTNKQGRFYFHSEEQSAPADRILLFVRTSHHCQSRLSYLLQSWIPVSLDEQKNLYLITDNVTNQTLFDSFRNIVPTDCPQTHNRYDLCCKTAHEFELLHAITQNRSNVEWMCRFDDDQYVNRNNLYEFLSRLNSSELYYIGRTSVKYRLRSNEHNRSFAFATYGAGVCFSRALLDELRPYTNVSILPADCIKRGISDDAYIGYLVEIVLNVSLTSLNDLFHSHLETLDVSFRRFRLDDLTRFITFGFAWDRYKLEWLPVIHHLIQLVREHRLETANYLWLFLRTYEQEHPENLTDRYDQSCLSYQVLRNQSMRSQRRRRDPAEANVKKKLQ